MKILWYSLFFLIIFLVVAMVSLYSAMLWMPGDSYSAAPAPPSAVEREIEENLQRHVRVLAETIGERHYLLPERLDAAAEYIHAEFSAQGYRPNTQAVGDHAGPYKNIEISIEGATRPQEIVVLGAHYDTREGSPGADDNASGVAVMLELARLAKNASFSRTVRLVAFTNEERPLTDTDLMGSRVYARHAKANNAKIVAMISLESLGIYTDSPNTQAYPPPLAWFYPSTGNFVAFVANIASRPLAHQAIAAFRARSQIPSEGVVAPDAWVPDIRRSDHASFWDVGYPAIMVTDTAPFRNPHYHTPHDLPGDLAYREMAVVTSGLYDVLVSLAEARKGK